MNVSGISDSFILNRDIFLSSFSVFNGNPMYWNTNFCTLSYFWGLLGMFHQSMTVCSLRSLRVLNKQAKAFFCLEDLWRPLISNGLLLFIYFFFSVRPFTFSAWSWWAWWSAIYIATFKELSILHSRWATKSGVAQQE